MSFRTRILRHAVVALAPLALGSGLGAGSALAQEVTCDNTTDFPCSYQLRDVKLQKVPAVFKFQSRVSQAKLPLGEGVFNTVYVKLLRGTEVKCLEQFTNVKVVDSTLNLEIGRNMNCELDEVIAENADLSFQICPGGQENCLQPVSLGSAPYAIKASFASIAQNAHHANQAGQASYAHRVTADRDLLLRNRLGTGYFDFFTPTAEDALALYGDAADFEQFENSGFIQWTPVRDHSALDIHVCGKDEAQDALVPLDSFNIAAADTFAKGDLTVSPPVGGKGLTVTLQGAHITGDSDVDGEVTITMATTVRSGGIHVTGDSNIAGQLLVSAATTIAAGGVHVTGHSDIAGELAIAQKTTVAAGGVHVTGDSNVTGALDVSALLHVGGAATVGGLVNALDGLAVTGDAEVSGRVTAAALETHDFDMRDTGGTAHRVMAFNGPTFTVNPDSTLQALRVNGPVRFTDAVIFEGGTVDPGAADAFILAQGEVRNLTLGGSLTLLDAIDPQGGVAGELAVSGLVRALQGLDVTGTATFHGPIVASGGVSGNLAVSGGLSATAASTFSAPVTLGGGVSGDTTFTGATTLGGGVRGDTTFNGQLHGLGLATLQSVLVQTTLTVNGAATFAGGAAFPGGISGNAAFANNVNVAGQTNLAGARVNGDLLIEGTTTFNGPVDFAGEFTGLTRVENLQVSDQATFNGPVALPGGIIGGLTSDSVTATGSLVAEGAATFKGAVSFQGGAVAVPNLVVTGNATFQSGAAFPNGLNSLGVGQLTVTSSAQINAATSINGNLTVSGDISVGRCRICINYGDNFGDTGRKHACTQLTHGAFSGIVSLSGDVDNNDVIALKFLCDNGGNESGDGWR